MSPRLVSAVADIVGTSEAELVEARSPGLSLADIAERRGVDIEALVTALLRTPREATERAVVAGSLGRNQADAIIARVADKLSERVTDPPIGSLFRKRHLDAPQRAGRRFGSADPRAGDDLPPAA